MPARSLSHSYGLPSETALRNFFGLRVNAALAAAGQLAPMTSMPLTYSGSSRPRPARPKPFQPLDPGIVDASIPTYFVGRNRDGFWLARDAKGENGGIFLFKDSALAFARRISRPRGCATILLPERFELDVENHGNRFIGFLKPILRRLKLAGRRVGR
jgi:hypothetical protein